MKHAFVLLFTIAVSSIFAGAQMAEPELLAQINRIKAVDNHSHISKVVGPGEVDDDFDALPCNILEGGPDPVMARVENPNFLEAWQKLYGYAYNDREPAHVRELVAAREKVMRRAGRQFSELGARSIGDSILVCQPHRHGTRTRWTSVLVGSV